MCFHRYSSKGISKLHLPNNCHLKHTADLSGDIHQSRTGGSLISTKTVIAMFISIGKINPRPNPRMISIQQLVEFEVLRFTKESQ